MPLFGRRQVRARVTGLTWSRVVQLERQAWVAQRSSWDPALLSDVRNVHKHTETRMEMVTDMNPGMPGGAGFPGQQMPGAGGLPGQQMPGMPGAGGGFGQSAPSMRMEPRTHYYYTYEALEWQRGAELRAWGTSQDGVAWPAHDLAPGERVGSRTESYSATFSAGDKQYEMSLSEAEWRALNQGGSCTLTLGLLGGVKKATRAGALGAGRRGGRFDWRGGRFDWRAGRRGLGGAGFAAEVRVRDRAAVRGRGQPGAVRLDPPHPRVRAGR